MPATSRSTHSVNGLLMTDTLRTRIATALAEAQEAHNGLSDLELADAVIRELPELTALQEHICSDGHPDWGDGTDCLNCGGGTKGTTN